MMGRNKDNIVSADKWDIRIRNNKRKRKEELKKHIFQFIFAVCFVFAVLFGVNSLISRAGDVKDSDLTWKYYKNICAGQGETLYSIAETYADKDHYETLDAYIKEVRFMNHLDEDSDIYAGYYLIIPYYSGE